MAQHFRDSTLHHREPSTAAPLPSIAGISDPSRPTVHTAAIHHRKSSSTASSLRRCNSTAVLSPVAPESTTTCQHCRSQLTLPNLRRKSIRRNRLPPRHHCSKHDDDRHRCDEHHRGRSHSRTETEGSRDRKRARLDQIVDKLKLLRPKRMSFQFVPDVEWWDVPLLKSGTYSDITDGTTDEENIKMEKINICVEHPLPIKPPLEPAPPRPQPLKLTKEEQKKLRTQRQLAREKDRQEMIRLGVLEPPKAKVKMSNLMKVQGSEATQHPTKLEMEIRSAAAEREQAHIDRNIARKLTQAERREKKQRKLFDDANTLDTMVSIFKINDLSHPQARFKVDINAHENRLTGCAIISQGMSVVVVEGGAKSMRRYSKLLLRRIDWTATVEKGEEKAINKCLVVWEGSVAKPSFDRFGVQECRTEMAALKFFSDHGVAHYWNLAVNFVEET